MEKLTAFKTLVRSPLRAVLTSLLIAAASFAFFSRIADYAVTTRETQKAEKFYSGVAALDNSVPPIGYYDPDPKPWPSDAQIEEFSSLPGVTLADTRYTTEGQVENYKRIIDQEISSSEGMFVLEGTYVGFEEWNSGNAYLKFDDVKVYAGELELDSRRPMKIRAISNESHLYNTYPRSFFEKLEEGSRCLVVGTYSEKSGTAFELGSFWKGQDEFLRVIDGLEEGYLETEEFAWYKEVIEATNQSTSVYDIVYTSDMRAIPFVNEHKLVISEGRPLTAEDTDACVVSQDFLETYGLSIGDRLHIELGDRLLEHWGTGGTRFRTAKKMTTFVSSAELEIIGAYRFADNASERYFGTPEWSYGPATVFVPSSLLPVEVPEDYEVTRGDFSVFIENPRDIKVFREAAEPLAAEMGLGLRFSDGGWSGMQDSFAAGPLASLLTTVLYVVGAALTLLLGVYLYIGRNKKTYGIMRTMGVPAGKAGGIAVLPLCILAVPAVAAGGFAGLFYASYTAAKTLARLSDSSAPEGYVYVLNAAIPAETVIFCLFFELAFLSFLVFLFLRRMKKTSPMELLQEGVRRTGKNVRKVRLAKDSAPVHSGFDMTKIPCAGLPVRRTYSALQQMCAYILRHMQRGIGKTAVSLALTVVLTAGIGTVVLARLSYQDAFRELNVKGAASGLASPSIVELSKSDLVKELYYYTTFNVRVNGVGALSPVVFTNDFDQYLTDAYTVTYANGYDSGVFNGTGAVCLIGRTLSETLGIRPGDEITLLSDDLYSFMKRLHEDGGDFVFYSTEEEFQNAVREAGKQYKVAGILESENADVNNGIFSVVNDAAVNLYSQPFQIGYCEFTLAENGKITELNRFLEEQVSQNIRYAPTASFHIDSEALEHVKRVRKLLESLFPIAVAAAVLIGLFGPGLIIIQSAQEAAFLRILGVTKKRVRGMFVLEQIVLCIAGIIFVAGVLALVCPGPFERGIKTIILCWLVYFLGCVCGAASAAIQVSRHRTLELLQVKE